MTTQEVEKAQTWSRGRHYTAAQVEAQSLEALRLKVLAHSDDQIAKLLGLSRPTVAKRIRHAINTLGQQTVTEYREIAKQRYEAGLQALVPLMAEGNLEAIGKWLDGTAKYAKLIGAEAPAQTQVEVTMVTEQEKQLRDLLAQAERDEKVRAATIVEGEVVDA